MPGSTTFWEILSKLRNRSPKADALNFDEEISLADIITKHSYAPITERLLDHHICQRDDLSPFVDPEILEVENEMFPPTERSASAGLSTSFHRLVEQMLFKSLEKEIQAPENSEKKPGARVTKIHQTLEAQLQNLIELIQDKIVCTTRVLEYPIASKAVDKVFEQDPVGFTDALCFVISTTTKGLAEDIGRKTLSLSHPDENNLRKKFYKLTTCIESLRKTRVQVFSQFNKQVIALLETMVLNNEFEVDEDRNVFPKPILPHQKSKYSSPMISDDTSFDSQFWGNYSKIMDSFKDDRIWKDPKELPHGEMELRWEAWTNDKISCRISADKSFHLSSLDIRMQLRILYGIIDLAATNVRNAESLLKKSLNDFHLAKQILTDFSKNIRISNLRAVEIQEILKVLRVSVATSVTFLKSIEKTTRMSRFCVSEGIQCLREALGQTRKNPTQFSYQPNYIVLSLTIKCGPGILPILKEVEAMSRTGTRISALNLTTENLPVLAVGKKNSVQVVTGQNDEEFALKTTTSSARVHKDVVQNE
ncbi:unnamed protein product [Allacma fusca]|uniref:Uncharacterized protein n=1 Tax=Allacma fusca TaxID=39272 RepID=A0A8J2LKU3_9HEXA|nr:unnamed protein product [Allacma fusca]